MFRGAASAVITPFKGNEIDYDSFDKFLKFQLDSGINGLIVLGTTGEAPTVTSEERREIISFAVKKVGGRVPVIIGTGSNSTAHSIELSQEAFELGADGVLVVTPYYNKPTQEGLYRHYEAIAKSVPGPVIIYNVPGRTGINIIPETVLRCAQIENIVGIKEASGNQAQVDELLRLKAKVRPEFKVWSGNDDQAFHLVCSGGDGVISVLSNVAPSQTVEMIAAALDGDLEKAREIHLKLFPLMKALFIETNPIPVKFATHLLGFGSGTLRLPLTEASERTREVVKKAMQDCGVLR
ncbi:4-hydroxy-tetrahydrodipicolinate synthase [Kosmotoga sp. DU53]|nr:4-hydroxy-tetrahydrodipicolinate synthase [Kosmotoga sp. DU53]MDK2954490.1 4-hydroxy-tetrahydrodipicolinate synthase [Kosmotoga sp.]OAA21966.1 4-hydroxy-tetrahydrodipicolinate synthase [Kosmotoga sp. DU53]